MTAEPHNLHLFDEGKGYYVAQDTDVDEPNCWTVCDADGKILARLDDDEFEQLRSDGPNPKGL